jgi:adenosylhomocysteine nucleosidase
MTIGIMSAMPEEIKNLIAAMGAGTEVVRVGMREFHKGTLWGAPVVLVFSRWGKVAAATTVTTLINRFNVDRILFTGVAGAADPALERGDVVVASNLYQHDMDARPLFPRFTIPLLGKTAFTTDLLLRNTVLAAARKFVARDLTKHVAPEVLQAFGICRPMAIEGVIASGDKFFASAAELHRVKRELPAVDCVEMEGAAVAQVCHEYGVPCAVVRIISDSADETAPVDFPRFTRQVAGPYSFGILRNLIAQGSQIPDSANSPSDGSGSGNRLRGGLPEAFIG